MSLNIESIKVITKYIRAWNYFLLAIITLYSSLIIYIIGNKENFSILFIAFLIVAIFLLIWSLKMQSEVYKN